MASKFVALCTLLAAANAGLFPGAVTTYSAAPLVRYSPATEVSHSYSSIGAPAALGYAAQAYSAPAYAAQAYAAPAYAAQAYAAPAYAAPAYTSSVYSAPAYAAQTYAAPAYTSAAYAAPIAKAVSYGPASVAVSAPAFGSTQQSVIRSFDGTVSQHSKAVDTAFSSVRKYDSRVNNNVYTPSIAKTYAYAAPAPAVYAQAAPAVYAQAAPAVVAHNTPVLTAHAPALYSAHATPAVTAYATKALSYSPASTVAHVSFNGYGATYGW